MADMEPETNATEQTEVESPASDQAAVQSDVPTTDSADQSIPLEDIRALPEDIDEDGFVSLWNIACNACNKNTVQTRQLASKLLLFLCKKECDFVVTSSTNAQYLDQWFERDKKILNDWKPESELVDVVAQHAEVPHEAFVAFLANQKFSPEATYTATRSARLRWFQEMWCVG